MQGPRDTCSPARLENLAKCNTELASSPHVDKDLVATGFNESMPLVELLRSIQSESVETNWLSEQVGMSNLTNQDG